MQICPMPLLPFRPRVRPLHQLGARRGAGQSASRSPSRAASRSATTSRQRSLSSASAEARAGRPRARCSVGGLIPHWAKDARIAYKLIKARAETLLEKNSYRSLVGSRRCLIVADGFYEWRVVTGGRKQPVRFSRIDEEPFAFAGLWPSWADRESGELIESCTIITTRPNELVAPVHDRMPVILPRDLERPWLDPEVEAQEAISLLQPYPAFLMKALPASSLVNSVRNDFPALLEADAAAA